MNSYLKQQSDLRNRQQTADSLRGTMATGGTPFTVQSSIDSKRMTKDNEAMWSKYNQNLASQGADQQKAASAAGKWLGSSSASDPSKSNLGAGWDRIKGWMSGPSTTTGAASAGGTTGASVGASATGAGASATGGQYAASASPHAEAARSSAAGSGTSAFGQGMGYVGLANQGYGMYQGMGTEQGVEGRAAKRGGLDLVLSRPRGGRGGWQVRRCRSG